MSRTIERRVVVWGGLALLVLLHLDFFRPQRPVLHFGWLPEELAYRLVWILFAWAYLALLTVRYWGGPEDESGG